MISLLIKIAVALKPFHKITYLLAIVIIVNMVYQLFFASIPHQPQNSSAMLHLLALGWLALVNLMLQVFTRIPEKKEYQQNFFNRIKSKLHQGVYYCLSFTFVVLSFALIVLSVKMLRL